MIERARIPVRRKGMFIVSSNSPFSLNVSV
jgi:hypothetical protein